MSILTVGHIHVRVPKPHFWTIIMAQYSSIKRCSTDDEFVFVLTVTVQSHV